MPLILRRDREAATDDFWLVYCDDRERVGRIYRQTGEAESKEAATPPR